MSTLSDSLGALARAGSIVLRIPTAIIVGWAGLVLVLLALESWALISGGAGTGATVVLIVLLALLALPVVVLAMRRSRWLRRTEQTTPSGGAVVVGSTDLVVIDSLGDRIEDEITGMEGEEDVRAVMDAFTELQLPPTAQRGAGARLTRAFGFGRLAVIGRVFGRIERAQRALLTAAGGPTKAPYLADDLRVTVAAFMGSLLTIAIGGLLVLVLGIALLAR